MALDMDECLSLALESEMPSNAHSVGFFGVLRSITFLGF